MEGERMTEVVRHAKAAGTAGLVALGDLVLTAHGIPPLAAPGLAAGAAIYVSAKAAFRRGLDDLGRSIELASGLELAEAFERIADDDDLSARLFAVLNALMDDPARERATVLGAILGESVSDEAVNEQDTLHFLLDVALGLHVGHLRLLQALELHRGDAEPGAAWTTREQLKSSLLGYTLVLDGLISAGIATGTIVQRHSDGLTYGPSAVDEWSINSLGVTIVGFLDRYRSADDEP